MKINVRCWKPEMFSSTTRRSPKSREEGVKKEREKTIVCVSEKPYPWWMGSNSEADKERQFMEGVKS